MAGTAAAWKTSDIALNPAQVWGSLAVPGAGAIINIYTDGTPDASANASAYHFGATKAGVELKISSSLTKYYVDEFRAPIQSNIDEVMMSISGEFVGVTDIDLCVALLPGVATKVAITPTPYAATLMQVGKKALAYQSIAAIFQLISAPTKYGVWNLYSALNDAGLGWKQSRKELGGTSFNFTGFELTSRAEADTIGGFHKQT